MTTRLTALFNQNLVKVVGVIITISLILFAIILGYLWLMYTNFNELVDKQFTLARLSDEVVYYDEVLTMSARMAALTGDPAWEARYNDNVGPLDEVVKQLNQLAPESYRASIDQTDTANVALVWMETRSFDLVRQGDQKGAQAVLFGDEYLAQKKLYNDGIQDVLRRSRQDADSSFRSFQTQLLSAGVAGFVILPLLILSWAAMFIQINQYLKARQAAEQQRERLIKELESAVLFKDQFLATMSHELRTPMNAVLGYTGIILQEDNLDDDVVNMLNRIKNNSNRLLGLINDILDISRINAERVEIVSRPIELYTMANNWHKDFQAIAENRKLAFEYSIDPKLPPTIIGDEERLTQITANLLQNAFKFTESGEVELRVEMRSTQSGGKFGSHLAIVVSDTGLGIPDTWQHLIFDEFRQVDGSSKRKYGGAGLGLSIVRKLCLLMGGTVTVSSKLGVGSTFTVLLPLAVPQLQAQVA